MTEPSKHTPMTDLKELRKLAQEATPGPWKFDSEDGKVLWSEADDDYSVVAIVDSHASRKNRAFIAAANPQTVIELLDRIAALEAALMPFAEEGRGYLAPPPEGYDSTIPYDESNLRLGHLIRAAKAMEGKP